MIRKTRHVIAPLLAIFILACVGCVNLDEVGKFSGLAASASSTLPDLVNDIKGSCLRFNGYAPENQQRDCTIYDRIDPSILEAQGVLTDYMDALGRLSSDKGVTYGKNLDQLPDKLKPAGFDQDQVKAAVGLSKVLLDAALNHYRQHKLSAVIGQSNDDVGKLTDALGDIVGKDYVQLLDNEDSAMDTFYGTELHEYRDREPLTAILVRKQYATEKEKLEERRAAAAAYEKVMTSIKAGHQKLYNSRNKLSSSEIINDLGPEIENITDSLNQMHKAFK